MQGAIDWAAIPIICDMFGIEDPEQFVYDLVIIRDHMTKEAKKGG